MNINWNTIIFKDDAVKKPKKVSFANNEEDYIKEIEDYQLNSSIEMV